MVGTLLFNGRRRMVVTAGDGQESGRVGPGDLGNQSRRMLNANNRLTRGDRRRLAGSNYRGVGGLRGSAA
jgi:hypothetical protein